MGMKSLSVRPTGLGAAMKLIARGSGARLHLERMTRGDAHWSHLHPERHQGELNSRARLTREQVEDMRARYASGTVSQLFLADEYHVAQTTISVVVRKQKWKE